MDFTLRRSRGAIGRYQAAPGTPLAAARVPRRPWTAPTTIPGVGRGLRPREHVRVLNNYREHGTTSLHMRTAQSNYINPGVIISCAIICRTIYTHTTVNGQCSRIADAMPTSRKSAWQSQQLRLAHGHAPPPISSILRAYQIKRGTATERGPLVAPSTHRAWRGHP